MRFARRVHRRLGIEELEPRVAPVLLTNGSAPYVFTDATGDLLQVRFSGPGGVLFVDATGGDPVGDDIAVMTFGGTTQSSKLIISDLNPGVGDDDVVLGQVASSDGAGMGTLTLSGTLANSDMDLPALKKLTAGGLLNTNIQGGTSLGDLAAGGVSGSTLSAPTLGKMVLGSVDLSVITTGGNIKSLVINGEMNGSTVSAANLSKFSATGNIYNTIFTLDGLGSGAIKGSILDGTTISTVNSLGKLSISGDMGEVTSITFGNGTGSLIVGGVLNGRVVSDGDFSGAINAGSVGAFGEMTINGDFAKKASLNVKGDMSGFLTVQGDLRGKIGIGGSLTTDGYINVGGDILPGASVSIRNGLAGIIVANTIAPGAVRVSGPLTGLVIQSSLPLTTLVTNPTASFVFRYGSIVSSIFASGPIGTTIEIFLLDPLSSLWSVNINGPLDTFSATDVVFQDLISNDTLGSATMIAVAGATGVRDLLQVGRSLPGDAVRMSGSIHDFSLLSGDLEGVIQAALDITGTIDIPGNLSGTIVSTQNILGDVNIGGSVTSTGLITAGQALQGNVSVTGGMAGRIGAGQNLTGDVSVGVDGVGSAGAIQAGGRIVGDLTILGDMFGLIRTGADLAGDVIIAGGIGPTGMITSGASILPALFVGGGVQGRILSNNDIPNGVIIGAGGLGPAGVIQSNTQLSGSISITGDMAGLIRAAGDISGNVSVTGNVTTSGVITAGGGITGAVSIGGGLAGQLAANTNIQNGVTIGGNVGGALRTITGDVGGDILIGGALPASGRIEIGRDISGALNLLGGGLAGQVVVGRDLHTVSVNGDVSGLLTAGAGILGAVSLGGGLSGQILANGPLQGNVTVNGPLSGTLGAGSTLAGAITATGDLSASGRITSGASIAGAISLGGGLLGQVMANGDIQNAITVRGAAGIAAGASVTAGGRILGDVTIPNGGLGGAISAGTGLSGNVRMLGSLDVAGRIASGGAIGGAISVGGSLVGNILSGSTLSGPITVGSDLSATGSISSGAAITGDISLGGSLLGQIVAAGNIAGVTVGGATGLAAGSSIRAGGQITGNILAPAGGVAGLISAGTGLSGNVSMAGGLSTTGVITSGAAITGAVSMGGSLAGFLGAGSTLSGPVRVGGDLSSTGTITSGQAMTGGLTIGGGLMGVVRATTDLGGNISIGAAGLARGATLAAGGAILGDVTIGGGVSGALTSGSDLAGNLSIGGSVTTSSLVSIGRDITSTGSITVNGNVDAITSLGLSNLSPFTLDMNPLGVGSGDFDRDGRQDVAFLGTAGVALFMGNGNGSFRYSGLTLPVGTDPRSITVADLGSGTSGTPDGFLDIAVPNYGSRDITLYFGNGDGTFKSAVTYGVAHGLNRPNFIAVADFNNDARPDMAVLNLYGTGTTGSGKVTIFLGRTDGTFSTSGTVTAPTVGVGPTAIAVGYFDAGTTIDMAVCNSFFGTAGGSVSILMGNGNGTFSLTAGSFSTGATNSTYVLALDLAGSTATDLVVANRDSNNVSVLVGNGNGRFQTASQFGAGLAPILLATTDINRDGRPDILVLNADPGAEQVSVLLGSTATTLGTPQGYFSNPTPSGMALADFTGDGRLDLVVANRDPGTATFLSGSTVSGAFFPVVGATPLSIVTGTFNADTIGDIVLASSTGHYIAFLAGNGNGTFANAATFGTGTTSGPVALAVGLIDSGTTSDIAVANRNTNNVVVFRGNGNGTFTTTGAGVFPVGTNPAAIVMGDFNNDGRNDLATANSGGGTAGNSVSILIGNGNGTFGTTGLITAGLGITPMAIAAGLLDADSNLDLVTANYNSNTVSVLLGNGNATFKAGVTYGVGAGPSALQLADVNGDGRLDIVVANQTDGSISILAGNGNGTFSTTGSPITGFTTPYALRFQDVNGDGRGDLLVTDSTYKLYTLRGNGDGTFQTPTTNIVGRLPASLAVGDFTGDGLADVVVGNALSNSLSVIRSTIVISAPTIQVGRDVLSTTAPHAIRIVGNLSGRLDIGGNHSGASPISIGGNLSGELLAALFGNVTISGDFTGLIGKGTTALGATNTLGLAVGKLQTGILSPKGGWSPPYGAGTHTINSIFKFVRVA